MVREHGTQEGCDVRRLCLEEVQDMKVTEAPSSWSFWKDTEEDENGERAA